MAVPLASGRLENPRIQIRSVDLRSRMSGGGRSAFCATRGFCPPLEEEVSSNRRAGETKIPTGVVVLESIGWETSASVSKSHPQSSCEFDSPAGDESARSSWQERSATVDGSVSALSKQAKAQNGACSTKSAVTVAMSQMCRFMRFANRRVLRALHSFSRYSQLPAIIRATIHAEIRAPIHYRPARPIH